MKRGGSKFLYLAAGLLIGYWAFHKSETTETMATQEIPAPPTVTTDSADTQIASPQLLPILPEPRKPSEDTTKSIESKPHALVKAEPKRELTLSFEETDLVTLENSNRIRDWAIATRKPGGWEIQILDEDSPFRSMGFASGDWIRDEAIQEIPRQDLRQRLISVLERIEK